MQNAFRKGATLENHNRMSGKKFVNGQKKKTHTHTHHSKTSTTFNIVKMTFCTIRVCAETVLFELVKFKRKKCGRFFLTRANSYDREINAFEKCRRFSR